VTFCSSSANITPNTPVVPPIKATLNASIASKPTAENAILSAVLLLCLIRLLAFKDELLLLLLDDDDGVVADDDGAVAVVVSDVSADLLPKRLRIGRNACSSAYNRRHVTTKQNKTIWSRCIRQDVYECVMPPDYRPKNDELPAKICPSL